MKYLLLLTALFITSLSAQAQQTVYRSEIPSKARSFLASNFRSPFHHAVKQFGEEITFYDIILNDKTQIKFSEKGSWTMIDGKGKAIPYSYLDKSIVEYIKANHAKDKVTRVEICDSECRLALSSGKALNFDTKGTLLTANN